MARPLTSECAPCKVRSLEHEAVVARLAREQVPLTCCPLSNHRMQLYPRFFCGQNPIRPLLEAGVKVAVPLG